MLYKYLKHVNIGDTIEVNSTWEFKNSNFQYLFFNWIISVIHGAKFTKFGTDLVEDHSEGTMSQIL